MVTRVLGAGLVLVVAWGSLAQGAPAKPNQPNKPNKPANANAPAKNSQAAVDSALLRSGKYAGKLLNVPGSDRVFTLEITYQDVQFNPNVKVPGSAGNLQQQMRSVQRLQQQAARSMAPHHAIHNMMQLQQAIMQMQMQQQRVLQQQMRLVQQAQQQQLRLLQQQIRAIQKMYKVVTVTKKVEFQAAPDVKVRTLQLPVVYDENGSTRKYTVDEALKLKGKDRYLPGYESNLESLQAGKVVEVTLGARKAPPSKKDLDGADVTGKEPSPEKKMQVRLIVVQKEPRTAARPGARAQRNN